MALAIETLADLVSTTQKNLNKPQFSQIAQTLTQYEVMGKLLKKENVEESTGTEYERQVIVRASGTASHSSLYDTDDVNVIDVMQKITVPLRFSKAFYAFDRREIKANDGPEKIVSLVKMRRIATMLSIAELMEETFWSKPASSSDTTTPWGVKMFMVSNSSTGFNGGNPTGFSSGYAGLSSTTYPKWSNYTAQYVTASKADLIDKMRTAKRKTGFKSPVSVDDSRKGTGQRFVIYVNEDTIKAMENIGEAQNENLGRDLAPYDDTMAFQRSRIVHTPQLDADTTDPVYMLDWSTIKFVALKGFVMHEDKPVQAPEQHNVLVVWMDQSWSTICTNRRQNALIDKA